MVKEKYFYNYQQLRGRIIGEYGRVKDFAKAMDMTTSLLYNKLNNRCEFKQREIKKMSELLKIEPADIAKYFFTV